MPLSADVHFNHRIAIGAIAAGIDKVRINPGNIGDDDKVREVVRAAKERGVPIRVGVNGGSIDRAKYPVLDAASLVASAMDHVRVLEHNDFFDIVVSIKASDVRLTGRPTPLARPRPTRSMSGSPRPGTGFRASSTARSR